MEIPDVFCLFFFFFFFTMTFSNLISIRWADLDPNFHLRHSVYYDFGAQQRIEVLHALGITTKVMQEQHFGPIIFREECVFRKEIKVNDKVLITTKVSKMRPDGSRWTFQHEFLNEEGKRLALLTLDGAWLDTQLRKLVSPIPAVVREALQFFPRTDDFVFI